MVARSHAHISLSLWDKDEFRALSPYAQHLYFAMHTSPLLSYCGVMDWRPNRIAPLAAGWTVEVIHAAGVELEDAGLVLIDEETEEALLCHLVRDAEYVKQPNVATAIATAYSAVASATLRRAIVSELTCLREEFPEYKGWKSPKLAGLLDAPRSPSPTPSRKTSSNGSPKSSVTPSAKGSGNPSRKASVKGSGKSAGNPSPSPSAEPSVTPSPEASVDPPDDPSPNPSGKPSNDTSTRASDDPGDDPSGEPSSRVHAHAVPVQFPSGTGTSYLFPPETITDSLRSSGASAAETIHAGHIVAAWVEGMTDNGTIPSKSQRGQAAAYAKELLDDGNDPVRVLAAARQAGRKGYATIDRELSAMNGLRLVPTTTRAQRHDPDTGRAVDW